MLTAQQVGHSSPDVLADWYERAKDKRLVMLAAYDNAVAVGSINIFLDGAKEPALRVAIGPVPMLVALGVNLAYRGQGIGRNLLLSCEAYLLQHPELPQQLALGVEPDNAIARALYQKLGYQHQTIKTNELYQTSWPENDAQGEQYIVTAHCRLMVKRLST